MDKTIVKYYTTNTTIRHNGREFRHNPPTEVTGLAEADFKRLTEKGKLNRIETPVIVVKESAGDNADDNADDEQTDENGGENGNENVDENADEGGNEEQANGDGEQPDGDKTAPKEYRAMVEFAKAQGYKGSKTAPRADIEKWLTENGYIVQG